MEPSYTTTVSIPVSVRDWMKKNDVKMRGLVLAGVRFLSGAPDRAVLEEQLAKNRADIQRLEKYRAMMNHTFKHHPEAYEAARRHIYEEEEK